MAKNEFLPFGIAEGANVLSNQEYERLAARFNGFISGVAKSKELNTVWRQSSVISSAIAQFIVDSDNQDLLDNGDVASIKTRLVTAIKQTISGVGYVTTAAMNLELNKKFDKANISGQKGNDNDKVPSLNLFTTEIGKLAALGYSYSKTESDGKYQLKGNYAPAGDYATNAALNNGLNSKVNKDNAEINSSLKIKYPGDYAKFFLEKLSGENFSIETVPDALALAATFFYKDKTGKTIASITVPKKSGSMALVSDIPKVTNSTGQSTTDVINQKAVTDALEGKFDKTGGVIKSESKAIDIQTTATLAGYIQISDENGKPMHQFGKINAGAALAIKNVSGRATLLLESDGIRFNDNLIALRNEIPTSATKFENVTSSRSNNVNYVNTKKHLIFVVLQSKSSVNQNATYTVNGVLVRWAIAGSAEGFLTSATIPVPPGATYSANGFEKWIEVS